MFLLNSPFQTQTVGKMPGLHETYLLNSLTKRPTKNVTPDSNYSTSLSLISQWSLLNFGSNELLTVGIQGPKQKQSCNIMQDVNCKGSRKSTYYATMKNYGDLKLHFLEFVEACAAKTYGNLCAISRRNTQNRTKFHGSDNLGICGIRKFMIVYTRPRHYCLP
jgi:hypothetical protein